MGEEPGKCGDPVEDVLRWILLVWDEIASPHPGMETPAEKRVTGSKLSSKQATYSTKNIGRKFFFTTKYILLLENNEHSLTYQSCTILGT